jgi:hypothetical protein
MNVQNFDNTPECEELRFPYETPELTAFSAPEQLGIAVGSSGCPTMYEEDGFNF